MSRRARGGPLWILHTHGAGRGATTSSRDDGGRGVESRRVESRRVEPGAARRRATANRRRGRVSEQKKINGRTRQTGGQDRLTDRTGWRGRRSGRLCPWRHGAPIASHLVADNASAMPSRAEPSVRRTAASRHERMKSEFRLTRRDTHSCSALRGWSRHARNDAREMRRRVAVPRRAAPHPTALLLLLRRNPGSTHPRPKLPPTHILGSPPHAARRTPHASMSPSNGARMLTRPSWTALCGDRRCRCRRVCVVG